MRQTGWQAGRQTDRQIDRQTEIGNENEMNTQRDSDGETATHKEGDRDRQVKEKE